MPVITKREARDAAEGVGLAFIGTIVVVVLALIIGISLWAFGVFASGSPNPVFFSSVKGKVSSTGSSMTASVGVERHGDTGGGNVNVQLPGDDLSFGPEECGDNGVFWFDAANVIHEWCQGPWLYTDAPLKLPPSVVPLQLVDGAKPSTTGTKP